MAKTDFCIRDEGTIIVIHPNTDRAKAWIEENVSVPPEHWLAGNLLADHRPAQAIILGILAADMTTD